MIGLDVIEPAPNSPWNNPMVVVKKPDGRIRYCIDARMLNSMTTPTAYPLPNLNRILGRMRCTRFLSAIDLSDAFWQVSLRKCDRPKTAFTVTGKGFYQFKRMPSGLRGSASTLCKLLDQALGDAMELKCFRYLDDFIIATETFEEHIQLIKELGEKLQKAGLSISMKKSKFCMKQLRFVGYLVDENGIRPDPDKIAPILDLEAPKTLKQLRSFYGMMSWYQGFCR